MKKITLLFVLLFVGFSTFAQTTHNLDWYMGITSADASLTIDVGDTVIWTFTDTPSHSVTSDGGSTETFDSGILSTGVGTIFSHTFNTAGSNPYHCSAHIGMAGTITVVAPPLCSDPSAVIPSNITVNSVDLDWTENGAATAWDIEIGPQGFAPTGTPTHDNVTKPYTVTGLSALTIYDVYLRADCGSSTSAWVGPLTFGTGCGTFPLPFTEDFESSTTSAPSCWVNTSSTTKMWEFDDSPTNGNTYDDHTTGSGYFAYVDASVTTTTTDATLMTPPVDISGLTTPMLEFWVYHYDDSPSQAENDNTITVEVFDGAAWQPVYFDGTGDLDAWQLVQVNLSTLTITGNVLARFIVNTDIGQNFYNDIGVDDISFAELPTCPQPSFLNATNFTGYTADLSWTDNAGATTWDVHVILAGDPAPTAVTTPTDAGVTTTTYNKTGLSILVDYQFYVRADCGLGDLSAWSGPFTFTSPCPTAYVLPYSEDFTIDVAPDCWAEAGSGTPATGPTGTSGSWLQDEFLNVSGSPNHAARNNFAFSSDEEWLISPSFDLSGGSYELVYRAAITEENGFGPPPVPGMGSDDEVQVLISLDNGVTWTTNLMTYNATNYPSHTGDLEIIDLSTYTGVVKFAFWANEGSVSDDDYDFFIDDFEVRIPPACAQPTGLTITNLTSSSADFNWTDNAGATTWNIEYGPIGFTQGTGTMLVDSDGVPSQSISGLDFATDYSFYVQADCGTGQSPWTGPTPFTTPCPTAIIPEYSEGFTTGVAPGCWAEAGSGTPATGPSGTSGSWLQDEFLNVSGSLNQAARNNFAFSSDEEWLISASIDLSGGSYELVYKAAITEENGSNPPTVPGMGSDDEVQVLISLDNGVTWTTNLMTYNAANSPSHLGDLEIIDLSAYTGVVKIAFWANEGSVSDDDYDFFIDDFEVRTLSTCAQPSPLTAMNITATGADLGWTENNTPPVSMWDVHIVPAGDPAPMAATSPSDPGITTNPYIKTGLTADTAYEFYVRADCGGGALSYWTGPFAFATPCVAVAIPYTESFTSGTFPSCWSRSSTTDVFVEATCGTRSNVLRFDQSEEATTGPIDGTSAVTGLKVSYYIADSVCGQGADTGEMFNVDYWDGTQWVTAMSYDASRPDAYTLESFIVPMSDVTASFQVRFDQIDGTTDSWFIDDVIVEEAPSCLAPTTLTATSILATTADLGWTDTNTPAATMWDVHVVLANDPAPTATTTPTDPGVMTNPHPKTGLTGNTNYEFYVRTDCGGGTTSVWEGPFAFKTACAAIVAPWFDDLETQPDDTSFTDNNCWTATATTSYDWNVEANGGANSSFTGPDNPYSGVAYFYIEASGSAAGETAELYTPMIDVSGLTAPGLKFYYHMYGVVMGELHVDVHDGTAWVNDVFTIIGQQQTAGSDPWLSALVDLSAYTGTIQIRFRAISAGDYEGDISLDDISVIESPTCLVPTTLTAATITTSSADLGWTDTNTPAATMWDVHVVTAGNPAPDATTTPSDPGVMANPYPKSGLSSGTTYEFYVRADCGTSGQSLWAGPFAFSTPCTAVSTFPWTESFETASTTKSCWTQEYVSGTEDWNLSATSNQNNTITPRTGAYMAEFRVDDFGPATKLITPPLDLTTLTAPQLTFYFANVNWLGDIDELRVYYKTSASGAWTQIGSDYTTEHTAWTEVSLLLPNPSSTYYIAFEATSNYARGLDLDDVTVGELPCLDPSALVANTVTDTSADLSWTAGGTETEWGIEYGPAGFTPGSGTIVTDNDGTLGETISSLTANTAYDFYVTAICGPGNTSAQVGPASFTTTAPPCLDPSALVANIVTDTSADLSWTAGGAETEWEIEYGTAGFTPGSGTIVTDNDGTLGETISSLTPNTVYDFYVTAICGPGNTSAQVGPLSFTTLPPPCLDPSVLVANNVTATAADITWTAGGSETEWEIEYGPAGFTPGSGTIVTDNDGTLGESILALSPSTCYDIYVTAICGPGNTSAQVGPLTFCTVAPPCPDPSALVANNVTDTAADLSWTAGGTETEWEIEYGTTGFAPGSGTVVADNDGTLGETISGLAANTAYDFYVTAICGPGDPSAQVGPASFTTLVSCPDVSNIMCVNITNTSIDLAWTAGGSETEWEIEYGITGFTPGSGTIITDNDGSPMYMFTGLTPQTNYDFYVTAICSNNVSEQVGPATCGTLRIVDQVFESFTYYPNPVSSELSLKANSEIQQVIVYDLLGQEVLKVAPNSFTPTLKFHDLQTGTYLMKVTINGSVGIFRIIKE